ncbi:hypothetical protein FMZ73_07570 [Salmonella enterica subsp. enterica]|nr:hypothetical protein [Salmonella enterica subsp. enterica serovar Nigeria]EHK8088958.1 hypothetical protein [Salmonella enterica subsp. enterica serovar Nigeria]
MNAKEQKLKALADARRRATLNVRTTSSASTTSAQSEVAESPPTVYQVPNINVPENLEEAAKLIQSELQKIAQSQSVLLTLWEKLKSQAATASGVEFTKPVAYAAGVTETYYNGGAYPIYINNWWQEEGRGAVWEVDCNDPVNGSYIAYFQRQTDGGTVFNVNGTIQGNVAINQLGHYYVTERQLDVREAVDREEIKSEIYAELQKLNAGLIVPIVINPE